MADTVDSTGDRERASVAAASADIHSGRMSAASSGEPSKILAGGDRYFRRMVSHLYRFWIMVIGGIVGHSIGW